MAIKMSDNFIKALHDKFKVDSTFMKSVSDGIIRPSKINKIMGVDFADNAFPVDHRKELGMDGSVWGAITRLNSPWRSSAVHHAKRLIVEAVKARMAGETERADTAMEGVDLLCKIHVIDAEELKE